ncbi:hypothetical protein ACNQR7_32610 [Mycolicibacterium senegalense]|uniref:hypothetical protein n=1 Tax=Mycolicibacterium senegalense TaxID=1796 RepID=UPI003AABCA24
MAEAHFDGGTDAIKRWRLGDSLTVVVPSDRVRDFVEILSNGEHSSLCHVMSANGIMINFRPEKDWSFEAQTGAGWIQLVFDREDDPSDCHVLARNITRTQAREMAGGLAQPASAPVPMMMNYLDDGIEAIAEVPVYFTAAGRFKDVELSRVSSSD